MKKYLELFSSISQLFVGWCIALGTILILFYCMDIQFYPKGIEIGDGLFFIWIALAFGGSLVITILLFSAVGLSLYSFISSTIGLFNTTKLPNVNNSVVWPIHILTVFLIVGICLTMLVSWLESKPLTDLNLESWGMMFVALLANGFIAAALIEEKEEEENSGNIAEHTPVYSQNLKRRKRVFKLVFSFMLFGIPFLFIKGFGDSVLSLSITDLGIKKENVSLYLNEKSSIYVSNLVEKGNYNASLVPVKGGSYRLDGATILFQGIGDISQVMVQTNSGNLIFDLPSDSFVVSKETHVISNDELANKLKINMLNVFKKHEIEFNTDTYVISFSDKYSAFNVGSHELSAPFKSVIKETIPTLFDFLNKHHELVKGIEVIGYSSNEWKKSDSKVEAYLKNHHLAVRRSSNMVDYLYETEEILSRMSLMINLITIKGVSSNSEARRNNRTVEIIIIPRLNKRLWRQ